MAQTVPARQTVQNMTEGSPVSLILRFALPIFISQVFQQLYSTADAFIVGKYLGTNAFAAVSSSGTLIMPHKPLYRHGHGRGRRDLKVLRRGRL